MIIDTENRFVFVAVAKTACTSIHRRFGLYRDPIPSVYHMFIRDILGRYQVEDFYKFAFVRNPYDRLVSAYYDFRYSPGHQSWATPIYEFNTFKDFVLGFENSPCRAFIHLQPQFDFLQTDGEIKMDFIGRYENLKEDFRKIEKELGLAHKELPVTRTSMHPDYRELYDEQTKQVVRRIYKNDFENFGYQK